MTTNDAEFLGALGPRHDAARKTMFLAAAKDTIALYAPLQNQRQHTRYDDEALDEIHAAAKKLHKALARGERRKLPDQLIREAWAWRPAQRNNGVPGPESPEFPNFHELLWQLAQSALWFMEGTKAAHRPDETWTHAGMVIMGLADAYYRTFGRRPGAGDDSPFGVLPQVFARQQSQLPLASHHRQARH